MSSRRTAVALLALGAAGALSVSGCASNASDEGSGPTGPEVSNSVGASEDLAKLVPQEIRSRGKLIIGVNVPYSPNEYIQNGKIDPTLVITHRMPLSEAAHGYKIFNDKLENCEKIVLKA